jgi:GGDEF domain-containing protein
VAPQHIRGIAERLRTVIARTPVLLSEEATVRVTASVGGASASPWRRMRAATLLAAADRQLMAARSRRKDHIAIDALPSMRVSLEERALLFGDSEGG